MIISDEYNFVFVHIPKCAGTTVRAPLQKFDSRNGAFTSRVDEHANLGNLDYVHIPLFVLRDYFPEEFEAARRYWSFAVVRDPFDRFASSVSQHVNMYSNKPIQKRKLGEIKRYVDEAIEYLSHQPGGQHRLPPEYIHFQKQVDYVRLDGELLMDSLYAVDEIDQLLADVGQRIGWSLTDGERKSKASRANQTMVFRNEALRWVIQGLRPLTIGLGKVLSERRKKKLRDRLYVPRDQRIKGLFDAEYVRDFVSNYYTEDIALYQQVDYKKRSEAS